MNWRVAVGVRSRGKLAAMMAAGLVMSGLITALVMHSARSVRTAALEEWLLGLAFSGMLFALALRPELRRLQRELAESRHEHARRGALLADASHELRMPLTIIRGESQVALRAGLQSSLEHTEAFERILEQTHVLTRVFDDLLLIARADAGGLRLSLRVIDIGELVCRVVQDFSTIARESGASVQAEARYGLCARADPDRLRQALVALIDNALRHAGAGVSVRVDAQDTADGVTITVTDNGRGIDPAMSSELFARFRRGATRGDGSGLGLSVVRALVEAHGGTARLGNAEQGGARATLRLPKNMHWNETTGGGWSNVVAAGGG